MNRRKLLLLGQNPCINVKEYTDAYADKINASTELREYLFNMFSSLCYAGVLNKFTFAYPFIGGTAETHKYDMVMRNNDIYNLSYFGAMQHTNNGAKGNGGYASTNYYNKNEEIGSNTDLNKCYHFILSELDESGLNSIYGGRASYGYVAISLYQSLPGLRLMWGTRTQEFYNELVTDFNNLKGIWTIRNIPSSSGENNNYSIIEFYHNGALIFTNSETYTYPRVVNQKDNYLFAINEYDTAKRLSRVQLQFFGASKDLHPTQISNLHAKLTDLQIYLNRKNW